MGRVRLGAGSHGVLACIALTVVAGCGHPATRPVAVAPSTTATASAPATTPSATAALGSRCPSDPDDLTASMATDAFDAVVRFNKKDPAFRPRTLRRDQVSLATDAGARGEQVAAECGAAVAVRTFVVMTTRTDLLPSQSASQGVYFVSRVSGHFMVWEQAH